MGTVLALETAQLEFYLGFLHLRVAPRVYALYEASLRRMPSSLTADAFDSYFALRLKTASGKTCNNELGVLKGYLRWLRTRGHSVPDALLTYPRFRHVPKKFRRALTAEEISHLRTVSGSRWAWWSFLLHTGLRKSEFQRLTREDVQLGCESFVRVRDAKTPTKERYVPLHDGIIGNITDGLFRTPKNLLRRFKKDLAKAGISAEIDLHCLRVTFVSALARAGVSPRTAQELAGHSDIRTTLKIYTKVTDRDKVDAVNRLVF